MSNIRLCTIIESSKRHFLCESLEHALALHDCLSKSINIDDGITSSVMWLEKLVDGFWEDLLDENGEEYV